MRGNVLGPVDKTVNVLIDRSYPVVKEVYKNLDAIKGTYENEEILKDIHKNLDKIEDVRDAANNLNRITQSIDKLDEVQANLGSINEVHQNLDSINQVTPELTTIKKVSENLEAINVVKDNVQDLDAIADNLEEIKKAAQVTEDIASIAPQIKDIQAVSADLETLINVSESLEDIQNVSQNIEAISTAESNAKRSEEALTSIKAIEQNVQADLDESSLLLAKNQGIYAQIVTKGEELINVGNQNIQELEAVAQIKGDELLNIAGTYYVPTVSKEGILFWTNTGGFENPAAVNITGPQGPKGEQGEGLKIVATYATFEDLIAVHPTGKLGDAYFIENTNEVYIWDIDARAWESIGELRGVQGEQGAPGLSANEILMDPDPVAYFDEIYGKTDLVTGDLVVDISGTEPDVTDIFEEVLK